MQRLIRISAYLSAWIPSLGEESMSIEAQALRKNPKSGGIEGSSADLGDDDPDQVHARGYTRGHLLDKRCT